jgi:hypothetical protein
MKILGFMIPNLDQFLSFLAITGSPCPFMKGHLKNLWFAGGFFEARA